MHEGSDFTDFTNKVKVEGDTVWSMLWCHHYHVPEQRRVMSGFADNDVEGQGHSRWNAPGNILVDTAFWDHGKSREEGVSSPSAHLLTPETATTTHYFRASGRIFLTDDVEMTRASERNMKRIFETEDGPMCEAQQRVLGSTDFLAAQPIILRADAAGLAARRISKRLRRAEADPSGTDARVADAVDEGATQT